MLIINHLRGGGSYITPNLCYIKETKGIKFEPHVPVSPYEPVYLQLILGNYDEYVDDETINKYWTFYSGEKDVTSVNKLFNFYKSLLVISEEHKKYVEENEGWGNWGYDIDITAYPFYVNGIKIDSIYCYVRIENYDYEHPEISYFSFYTDQLLIELCLQLGLDLNSELLVDASIDCYLSLNNISVDLYYNSLVPQYVGVGDVAYWDGSKVKTTPLSNWNTSLGTAIGVVVIPEGFAPDGKTRIVGLKLVDTYGNQSSSYVALEWTETLSINLGLTDYTKVPTTDNAGSTSSGSYKRGYLPSDNFTGATSFVDPKAKYYGTNTSNMIPSPYLGDTPNPEYYKTLEGGNVLSDFNGLSNTQTLVGLGSDYKAANACWKYKDGSSTLQWYLPAAGELGYVLPRFNEINATLTALGGLAVSGIYEFWSSSKYSYINAYYMNFGTGYVNSSSQDSTYCVRPFASF